MENHKKIKRIGIDARFYGPIGKGLGRYTQEIVDNVIKVDQENEYVIFLRQENFDTFQTDNPRVKKVIADVRWYSIAEQVLMPFYIWKERLDFIHFPHFNVPIFCPCKFIVTIHDLILIHYPTIRASTLGPIIYKIKNIGYRLVIWLAVKRAKKIITVSEFTKKDIMEVFGTRADKIIVTYEGVSENLNQKNKKYPDDKECLLGYNINKPYILYVGNVYPHKNLDGLLKVFVKIREKYPDYSLVLIGKSDYFYDRLEKLAGELKLWNKNNQNNSVIFAGYVPDEDLACLYREAESYVFPSLYEGFGLPPLEAMAHGLAVISSNRASMPEILGNAALYFDPNNEKDAEEKIEKIISDQTLRDNLRQKGYENVKRFSWDDCIEKTLNIYKTIE